MTRGASVTSFVVTIKRLFWAALVGILLAGFPLVLLKIPSESVVGRIVGFLVLPFALPGTFIGVIAALGRVHDADLRVIVIANFILYFVVAYIALGVWDRRKARSNGIDSNEIGNPPHLGK
jgi:hypothetical protein